MAAIFVLGRIILGAYYLFGAFHHFSNTSMLAHAAAAHGVPAPTVAIIGSGLLLAIAGVTLILGVFPRVGVAALVLFLVPVSFFMHAFWTDTNAATRMARHGQLHQEHGAARLVADVPGDPRTVAVQPGTNGAVDDPRAGVRAPIAPQLPTPAPLFRRRSVDKSSP